MDGMAGMALILVIAATLATSVHGDPITVKLRLREEREVLREVKELEAKRHELRPEHYHVAIRRDNWRDEAHLVCRQWR